MSEAPSWLSSGDGAAGAPPAPSAPGNFALNSGAPPPPVGGLDNGGAPVSSDRGASSPYDGHNAETTQSLILIMRVANIGVAVATMVVSGLITASVSNDISKIVLCGYALCFSILLCCLEMQLKFLRVMIAVNFGFLFHWAYRFIFNFMMASILWATDHILGKFVAAALVGIAVYNTYILIAYPSYRRIREDLARDEDKRIEDRISQEVRKKAVQELAKGP